MDDVMEHLEDTIDNREIMQRFLPALPDEEQMELEQPQKASINSQEAEVKEAMLNTVIEKEEDTPQKDDQEALLVVKENPFEMEQVIENHSNVEQNEVTNPVNTTAQFIGEQEEDQVEKLSEAYCEA